MTRGRTDLGAAKTMGWLLGIGLGLLVGGPLGFALALASISGALKLADWTHLPIWFVWVILVIYTGVAVTFAMRVWVRRRSVIA